MFRIGINGLRVGSEDRAKSENGSSDNLFYRHSWTLFGATETTSIEDAFCRAVP